MRRARRRTSAYELRLEPAQLEQLKLELVENLRPQKKLGPEFTEFAARFLVWAHTERQKPSGLAQKTSMLRLYLTPQFRGRRLGEITEVDILELKQKLTGRSPKTVANLLTVLRKMLALAVQWRELDAMPVHIASPKLHRPALEFYDYEQYARLVAGADRVSASVHAMVLLAGDAGLRMGELLALEWGDVDLQRRELAVRRSEWRNRIITLPKSGKPRSLPMTLELTASLERLAHERSLKDHAIDKRSPRVLVKPGGARLTVEGLRTWMRRAQKNADLPITARVHVLRHTFCSHLAMRGAALVAIRNLAGHEHASTTLRYMHLADTERIRTIGLLDAGRSNQSPAARESL